MCGINGIALDDRLGPRLSRSDLERMRDTMVHRGPDDHGLFIAGNIGIGHRRLSIVDVAAGKQPMSNEDDTIHIVFNGEIYNHGDFRKHLEGRGHRYRTHCDTETILHLYEEYGEGVVDHLRGMFAFAIYDESKQQVLLARDRLGIKPLYYVHNDDGSLYFASEIKALIAAGAVKPELNFAALPDYFANRAPSGEETLFAGVRRLMPGHTLLWRNGQIKINRYWDLSFQKSEETLADNQYVEQFADLFRESVRLRLMADVPLGMFLSGGIDSSAIAAMMSEMVSEPIKTFSVAFADREANELEYARLVARAFKTDHREIVLSPQEFFNLLPQMIYQEDEPIAHPSSIPLYAVSHLASQHVKVVLTGEGSDELLAGYDKYRKTIYNLSIGKMYDRMTPDLLQREVIKLIGGLSVSSTLRQKLARTFLCVKPDIDNIYFDNFSVFSRARQAELFTGDARSRIDDGNPYRTSIETISNSDAESMLDKLLAADMKTYLHELLMKQDQMSMAASIESRVPFLDHKLVEFATRLPERMKLRGITTKYILRQAMRNKLPKEILSRKKMGFPVPIGKWLRGPFSYLVDEYILSARTRDRGVLKQDYVRELVRRHNAGENHSERLWSLINFEIWQRQFIEGEAIAAQQRTSTQPVPHEYVCS
jgi:asparagine synthase (glutamine-hydrolysing)